MPRWITGLLVLAMSAGCSGGDSVTPPGHAAEAAGQGADESPARIAPATAAVYVYTCDRHPPITARFGDAGVHLDLITNEVFLPQTASASGARFASDDLVFWSQGQEAMFETTEATHRCTGTAADSPWHAARLRGARVRALGQEPGWVVEVVPAQSMHYRGDYGAENIVAAPVEVRAIDGGVEYRAAAAGHRLILRVTEAPCVDVMSGEPFELTAVVEVDDRRLHGCGRSL